jgi:hypothetical protein
MHLSMVALLLLFLLSLLFLFVPRAGSGLLRAYRNRPSCAAQAQDGRLGDEPCVSMQHSHFSGLLYSSICEQASIKKTCFCSHFFTRPGHHGAKRCYSTDPS